MRHGHPAGGGERALILGLGRFGGGREAARHLLRQGFRVRIRDDAPAPSLAAQIAELRDEADLEWHLAGAAGDPLEGVDLLVANPGVPSHHPLVAAAVHRGIPVTQEINLVLESFPGRTVLVTGTNGKSTTATMLASALRAAGLPTLLGGNIGHSLLADEARWTAATIAVLEVSSFQLERVDPARHAVAGAVFTPVTSDHLDRHGTLTAYRTAKARAAAMARDFIVHQADDPVAGGFESPARRRVTCRHGTPDGEQVGLVDGWIHSGIDAGDRVLHRDALLLPGAFQAENAMLAYAAARQLGADRQRAAVALCRQRPLPFRLQRLARAGGVELYDNSVSTELQSTLSALSSLPAPVHWVGGGKSKDGDYRAIADVLSSRARSAHVFGVAAAPLAELLRGRLDVTSHRRLEDALDAAWARATPGQCVLFSPAFASFDQFPNFRARARAFHRWAERLGG